MTDLLNQLVAFIGENPTLANVVVFLIAMGEALFIIGLFVPSTVVLVGAGTLVGLGKLESSPIFFWTMAGAIVGDAVSYWIGHYYRDRLKTVWPFSRYRSLVERGEAFFRRHGGKSVFIGRFVPGVKAIVPGIAGMAGMNATRFTVINVVSAFAWTIAHLGPGFIAGTAFSALGEVSGRLAAALGVLVGLLFVAVILGRWMILIFLPLFSGSHAAIVAWFARRPDRPSQWIARTFDPDHPRSAGMLVSALLLLVTIPAFVAIVLALSPGDTMERADVAIRNLFLSMRTPVGDRIMVFLTMLGDGFVTAAVTAIVVFYLVLRRAWRRGTGFLIAMTAAAVFVPLFKVLTDRARPTELLYTGPHAFSFPSGHATINTVLFGIIAVLVAHDRSPLVKAGVFSVAIAYIGAIAFSRVYLGAHWFSDVVGGLVFGTAMVSAFAFIFGSIHNEKVGRWWLASLVTLAVGVVGGTHVATNFADARDVYAPRPPIVSMARSDWLAGGWRDLPSNRIELNGEKEEPLVIQWAGAPNLLEAALRTFGFERAPRWSLANMTGFLVGQTEPEALPVLPRTHNGRGPELVLIKQDATTDGDPSSKGRWVLRLWPSSYVVEAGGGESPVYVGSLVHERLLYPLDELSTLRTDSEAPSADGNPLLMIPDIAVGRRDEGPPVVLGPVSAEAPG